MHQLITPPFTGPQREGHTGGEQLSQVEEEAHDGLGAQA